MAGSYPGVPGLRMAYDRDGTAVAIIHLTSGTSTAASAGEIAKLNDEDSDDTQFLAGFSITGALAFIFPELRDIAGYVYEGSISPQNLEYSTNTTNGLDGTWTSLGGYSNAVTHPTIFDMAALRSGVQSVSASAVKGIRFRWATSGSGTMTISAIHLFGSPSSGQNPDRLRWWQPVTNAEVPAAYFDLGDVPRGSTDIVQFRIKNNSATFTAESIEISAEAPTDTTPTNVGQHQFSDDGASYSSTLNIGDLAPGALSSVLYVRRDTSASAALSVWWTRFVATAASWV